MTNIHTLTNGVRVVVDPMADIHSAAIGVWVNAGAMDESEDENGLAHLLEHMVFKGTKTRSAKAIAEEMEAIGGHLNASTGYQRTGYYARLLGDDVATGFDIVADLVNGPIFDENELAKEKEVVRQEIADVQDTPDDLVFDMLQAAAFPGSSFGRPILGDAETVRRQTRENLSDFMARNYRAGDIVIGAAGRVDEDEILKLSERYFSGARDGARDPRPAPPENGAGQGFDDRDIEQTHVALAFPGASNRSEDYFAMRVFAEALGGGMSSRIFQEVREERGLAYSAYAYAEGYDETGLLCAYLGTDAQCAPEAVGIVRAEIAKMADGPNDAELGRAKALLRSSLLMGRENTASRAEAAAGQLFVYGRVLDAREVVDALEAVDAAAVSACAARALSRLPAAAVVGACDRDALKAALAG